VRPSHLLRIIHILIYLNLLCGPWRFFRSSKRRSPESLGTGADRRFGRRFEWRHSVQVARPWRARRSGARVPFQPPSTQKAQRRITVPNVHCAENETNVRTRSERPRFSRSRGAFLRHCTFRVLESISEAFQAPIRHSQRAAGL